VPTSIQQTQLRDDFEIEVSDSLPTKEQLSTIIDYLAAKGVRASAVVDGAASKEDAFKKLSEDAFRRPVVRFLSCRCVKCESMVKQKLTWGIGR
jgi:hypothetical protein